MFKELLKNLNLVLVVCILTSCTTQKQTLQKPRLKKIFLIGDSTCADFPASRYPLTGWGSELKRIIVGAEIKNHALNGRSSKSFYEEENAWTKTFTEIEKGNYVLIQFGHNDQKNDSLRNTKPESSYKSYLLKYINDIRSKKAHPILVTSINKNFWQNDSILLESLGEYPQAMRELSEKEKIPLIDLNHLTKKEFEKLGKSFVTDSIFMNLKEGEYKYYPNGFEDNVHLQEKGAKLIAKILFDELLKLRNNDAAIKSLFN